MSGFHASGLHEAFSNTNSLSGVEVPSGGTFGGVSGGMVGYNHPYGFPAPDGSHYMNDSQTQSLNYSSTGTFRSGSGLQHTQRLPLAAIASGSLTGTGDGRSSSHRPPIGGPGSTYIGGGEILPPP